MNPVLESVGFFWLVLLVASTIGTFIVTKLIGREDRVKLRMVTQPVVTVVGMMFVIMLGFFVAQALKDYGAANAGIINEANSLGNVFRDARGFSEVDRVRIRGLCRNYVEAVINDEWQLLAQCKESDTAEQAMNELFQAGLSVKPTSLREQVIYESFFKALNELAGYRRMRIATNTAGLAPHMWAIIAIGAAALVSLTFLFAPESKRFHAGLLMCLLTPLTLNVYLLADFTHPFSGLISVKPDMFELLKRKILTQEDSALPYLDEPARKQN